MKPHEFRASGPLRPLLQGPRKIELLVDDFTLGVDAQNAQDATAVCVPHDGPRSAPLWRVVRVFATYAEAVAMHDEMPPTGRAIFRLQNDRKILAEQIVEQHADHYMRNFKPAYLEKLGKARAMQMCMDTADENAKAAPTVTLVSF